MRHANETVDKIWGCVGLVLGLTSGVYCSCVFCVHLSTLLCIVDPTSFASQISMYYGSPKVIKCSRVLLTDIPIPAVFGNSFLAWVLIRKKKKTLTDLTFIQLAVIGSPYCSLYALFHYAGTAPAES